MIHHLVTGADKLQVRLTRNSIVQSVFVTRSPGNVFKICMQPRECLVFFSDLRVRPALLTPSAIIKGEDIGGIMCL